MSGFPLTGQDRLVLLGLGLASCAVLGLMRQMLVYYRDASIIPHDQIKSQYITQQVEDSLKVSTLDKLLDSPNYCIQETTSIIICERALHDEPTMAALLWYITRPEHKEREKGIRALTMMMNSSTVRTMHKPEAYAALVKSLEYSITDYEHNSFHPEWDNWHYRDVVEQGCLLVLGQLVEKFGVDGLVRSRFIERWVAKEPWGESDKERETVFQAIMGKHQRLNDLLVPLFRDRRARKQLIKARLVPLGLADMNFPHRSVEGDFIPLNDIRMINGESTAGEDFDAIFVERPRRSSEDEHLRRRNREAMVLNDGGPLRRGDIIQRERRDE